MGLDPLEAPDPNHSWQLPIVPNLHYAPSDVSEHATETKLPSRLWNKAPMTDVKKGTQWRGTECLFFGAHSKFSFEIVGNVQANIVYTPTMTPIEPCVDAGNFIPGTDPVPQLHQVPIEDPATPVLRHGAMCRRRKDHPRRQIITLQTCQVWAKIVTQIVAFGRGRSSIAVGG